MEAPIELGDVSSLVGLTYVTIFNGALIIYDILITLADEIELVWKSGWNVLKVLYLCQRYLTIFDIAAYAFLRLKPNVNPSVCGTLGRALIVMQFMGVCLSEALLTIRTLAAWGAHTRIKIFLLALFFTIWMPLFVILGLDMRSVSGVIITALQNRCIPSGGNSLSIVPFILLLAYDIALSITISIPGWRLYRSTGRRTQLSRVVYEEGIIYYMYTAVLTVAIIISIATVRVGNIFPQLVVLYGLGLFSRCMYSILTSRVVLSIRRVQSRKIGEEAELYW